MSDTGANLGRVDNSTNFAGMAHLLSAYFSVTRIEGVQIKDIFSVEILNFHGT